MRKQREIALFTLIASAVFSIPLAYASDTSTRKRPTVEVSAAAFFTDSDISVRADSPTLGLGATIDLERDLGFDKTDTIYRLDGLVRVGKRRRHAFEVSYFDLSRTATDMFEREIQFRDTVFDVDAEIDADFDFKIYKAAYSYVIIDHEKIEFSLSVGVSITEFAADIAASVGDPTLGGIEIVRERVDRTLSLPTIGVRKTITPFPRSIPKLSLHLDHDLFFFVGKQHEGSLHDTLIAAEYEVAPYIAIGAGFDIAKADYGKKLPLGDIDLDVNYHGPLAYLKIKL